MYCLFFTLCLNGTRQTYENCLTTPPCSAIQAFGLADMFAADQDAKRLVLQPQLNIYVPIKALVVQWGSDTQLVSALAALSGGAATYGVSYTHALLKFFLAERRLSIPAASKTLSGMRKEIIEL